MVSCKIKGCKNRSDKKGQPKLHFFSFPKDPETASKWIEVCKHSVNIKNSRVCSVHFQPSCYKPRPLHLKDLNYSQSGVRTLLPDAVPTESIASDDASRSVTKHQKRAQNPSNNNNNNQNVLHVSNSKVNEKVPAVLYLRVLDNNPKHQFKSVSTPPKSFKYISGHSNLDVRLERIEAPSYILDHQYAANSNQNLNVIDDPMKKNENNSTEVYKTTNLEIRPKLNNSLSDQDQIAQLKRQLQIKTMEHQTVQKQLKRLQNESKNFVNKRVRDILKNVFSTNQIDKLINPFKSKIKWSIEDIISAISLQNISLKAYSYLRNNNYPLPGLSTIRKWTANIKVAEGLLTDILTVMKHRTKSLSVFQKIVILNFGEISIAQKNCQICIVRGLFYKWIQPIYYSFDKTLTTNIVKEIISKLYDAEYIVVAITSNYQSFDDQIWTDLNIGVQNSRKCYFDHPKTSSYKVFVFPCESNLLSLIGQYFFKSGFIVNGKQVNKRCLEEIAEINKNSPGENVYKLTSEFLGTYKSDQSAFLIKKLFTKEIASEITYFGHEKFILYKDWKYVAEFFESLGNWIDLCNSQVEEGFKEGEEPYGFHLEYQNKVMNKMEKLMLTTKIVDSEKSSIIQDQVILKSNSLKELLIYLQQNFSIEDFQINYILTARFSDELLEHFYEYLSDQDVSSDNFAITNFQNKLRKCLLGKHFHDASFRKVVKYPEPCLIDFNEKSDATADDIKQPKGATIGAAGKIRRFLTINNIPAQRVHKNLLHILGKKETEK
ncbi:uncharacterized protein LOC100678215 [Nasonia vitripennis]|uniref:THAP-type domain-containing protein n=1 Tax=Nasonia vitripennis TaxID=7425 RepID=A0A7M7GDF2_NASVI|nr:uncharacterized protein LOC100678215 [Nasonia vitripennis]